MPIKMCIILVFTPYILSILYKNFKYKLFILYKRELSRHKKGYFSKINMYTEKR